MMLKAVISRSLKTIIRDRRFMIFFALNLVIGLASFEIIQSFRSSMQQSIHTNEQAFLAADFAFSARRDLKLAEVSTGMDLLKKNFPEGLQTSDVVEMYSMIKFGDKSKLVQLKFVDSSYPFYGELRLQGAGKIQTEEPVVYVYPELLRQLGAQVSDQIQIGDKKFIIKSEIVKDSTQTFRMANLAPKIYLGQKWLSELNLLMTGSTVSRTFLVKFPQQDKNAVSSEFTQKLKTEIETKLSDSSIEVTTPKDAAEQAARVLSYLSDYLGLGSVVSLLLTIIGTYYLVSQWQARRQKSWAIYQAIGESPKKILLYAFTEMTLALFAGGVLAHLLSLLGLPTLLYFMKDLVPADFVPQVSIFGLLINLLICLVISALMFIPVFSRMISIPTSQLFSEGEIQVKIKDSWIVLILKWLPLGSIVFLLSFWAANSIKIAQIFLGAIVATFLFSSFVATLINYLVSRLGIYFGWKFRFSMAAIRFYPIRSLLVVISLTFGILLLTLLPRLKDGLAANLANPESGNLPALFLVDIQDEQLDPLHQYLESKGVVVQSEAPMIRARILSVNDVPFERASLTGTFVSREKERESRMRNRGVNLSFRPNLEKWESLDSGEWIAPDKISKLSEPAISLEIEYAKRLGIRLQDKMVFDIQGVEFSGVVKSFRKVKWNSFQPNFFILIQSDLILDSPKIWIATISDKDLSKIDILQNELNEKFSNVSAIDVHRLVDKVVEIMNQMQMALQLMAALCVAAGLMLIFSIFSGIREQRKLDFVLLGYLGATERDCRRLLAFEIGYLSVISILIGNLLSFGLSAFLMRVLFG